MQSSSIPAIKQIIHSLEEDITTSESFSDDLQYFSPILWLEAPHRTYATDSCNICILDPNAAYSVFINTLSDQLSKLIEDIENAPKNAKFILVLCQLINIVPIRKMSVDLNASVSSIVQSRDVLAQSNLFDNTLIEAVDRAVKISVIAGANPIPGILSYSGNKLDKFLSLIPIATWSGSTIQGVFNDVLLLAPTLPSEKHGDFITFFYNFLSSFYISCPNIHADMIRNGVDQALNIIDIIRTWKPIIDKTLTHLYCALIPLCNDSLRTLKSEGRSHQFSPILQLIEKLSSKKVDVRYSCSMAYVELKEAVTILGNNIPEYFSPIIERLNKVQKKISKLLTNKSGIMNDARMVEQFLPRLAAIEFINMAKDKPSEILLFMTKQLFLENEGKVSSYLRYLELIYHNYPCPSRIENVPTNVYQQMYTILNKCITGTKIENENIDSILHFIGDVDPEFSLYSLTTIQGLDSSDYTNHAKQHIHFIQYNNSLDSQAMLCVNLLHRFSECQYLPTEYTINFFRQQWTYDSFWDNYLSASKYNKLSEYIAKVGRCFQNELEKGLLINSLNLQSICALFFHFVHWIQQALSKAPGNMLSKDTIRSLAISSIYGHAITGDPSFDRCDQIISDISAKYNIDCPVIYNGSQITEEFISSITLIIINQWFNLMKKYIPEAKANLLTIIPNIGVNQVKFLVSTERISLMVGFIAKHLYTLNNKNLNSLKPIEYTFFYVLLIFIDFSKDRNLIVPRQMRMMNMKSFNSFAHVVNELTSCKAVDVSYTNPYFWLTLIDIFTEILRKNKTNVTSEQGMYFEQLVSTFISISHFNIFESHDQLILRCTSQYLAEFFNTKFKISSLIRYKTFFILCQLTLKYGLEVSTTFDEDALEDIFSSFPTILNGSFDVSEIYPHISFTSAQRKINDMILYMITIFNIVAKSTTNVKIYSLILESLVSFIKFNSAAAWPYYCTFVPEVTPIMQEMLLESLTLINGMSGRPILYEEVEDQLNITRRRSNACFSLESSYTQEPNAINKIKSFEGKTYEPFEVVKKKTIYSYLTENNYDAFINPVSTCIAYLESAIRCLTVYNLHDEVFDLMCEKAKVSLEGSSKAFFTAFFKAASRRMKFLNIAPFFKITQINYFLRYLGPSELLAFYLRRFYLNTGSREKSVNVFVECFLRPLVIDPVYYGVPITLFKTNKEVFIRSVQVNPLFNGLIDTMINSVGIYPSFTWDYTENDLSQVQNFLIDKNGVFVKEQYHTCLDANVIGKEISQIIDKHWVINAGKRANGNSVIVVNTWRYPNVRSHISLDYFFSTLPKDESKLELFINIDRITESLEKKIDEIFEAIAAKIDENVAKIYIFNVSYASFLILNKMNLDKFKSKIEFVYNIEDILDSKENIHFPTNFFNPIQSKTSGIIVDYKLSNANITNGVFQINEKSFDLLTESRFLGKSLVIRNTVHFVNIASIVDDTLDGEKIVKIMCNHCNANTKEVILFSKQSVLIKAAITKIYDLRKVALQMGHNSVDKSISPSLRNQSIALAISILAKKFNGSALNLFEAAMKTVTSNFYTSHLVLYKDATIPLTVLFDEIEQANLVCEVTIPLLHYMQKATSFSLFNTLPLFVKFFNKCSNICMISKAIDLLSPHFNNEDSIRYIDQRLLPCLRSPECLSIIIPALYKSCDNNYFISCAMQTFMRINEKVVCDVIYQKFFYGTILTKSYNVNISFDKIFSTISKLPFNTPSIVENDFPLVMFCAFAGCLDTKTNYEGVKLFVDSLLIQLQHNNPNIEPLLVKQQNHIMKLLNTIESLDPLEILLAGDDLMKALSDEHHKKYQYLLETPRNDLNPTIRNIKFAAEIFYGHGSLYHAETLISKMTSIYSSDFGAIRLGLCFDSLSKVLHYFPEDNLAPLFLIWAPLIGCCHSNKNLRLSSIKLIHSCVEFSLKNGKLYDLNGILTTQYISQKLVNIFQSYGKELNVDFDKNICHAITGCLMYALDSQETRAPTVDLLKYLFEIMKNDINSIYFALPIIAYSNEDESKWILDIAGEENSQITEYLFKIINENSGNQFVALVSSLFWKKSCSKNINVLGNLMEYGAINYPDIFCPIRSNVVQRCWSMLDFENETNRIDKISCVSAIYLGIPENEESKNVDIDTYRYLLINEENLGSLIERVLKAINAAIYFAERKFL